MKYHEAVWKVKEIINRFVDFTFPALIKLLYISLAFCMLSFIYSWATK